MVMSHVLSHRPCKDIRATGNPPRSHLVLTTAAVVHTKHGGGTFLIVGWGGGILLTSRAIY